MRQRLRFGFLTGLLISLLGGGIHAADCRAANEVRGYSQYRIIATPAVQPGKTYRVVLDAAVYSAAQPSLADIRVVGDDHMVVPYSLALFPEEHAVTKTETALLENTAAAGTGNRIIVDLQNAPGKNNRLTLDVADRNFGRRVIVEGSNDRVAWEILTKDVYIYDFSFGADAPGDGVLKWQQTVDKRRSAGMYTWADSRNTTVTYPENTFRYLRVSVVGLEDDQPLTVRKVTAASALTKPAEETEIAGGIVEKKSLADTRSTELTIDLGQPNPFVSRVKIACSSINYYRTAYVAGSHDRTNWQNIGQGEIFDYNIDNFKDAQREIAFAECRFRYLKLTILDEDNPPLKIDAVTAVGLSRSVVFTLENQAALKLYYGNAAAAKPVYDYARFVLKTDTRQAARLALGQPAVNPLYVPEKIKRPWTEERPYLLWGTLGMIVLILLGLVGSMLKKVT